jgi:hypothetical protein
MQTRKSKGLFAMPSLRQGGGCPGLCRDFGHRIAAIGAICKMETILQIVAVLRFTHNETSGATQQRITGYSRIFAACISLSIGLAMLSACRQAPAPEQSGLPDTLPAETPVAIASGPDMPDSAEFEEYATFFLAIADTGEDYFALHEKMLSLHSRLGIPIDTLGRSYDPEKNRIALPEDDEDEMYAGDYFPRRFPSEHLSIEYLLIYMPATEPATMALVAGIFQDEAEAAQLTARLKDSVGGAFVLKSEVYVGCMH